MNASVWIYPRARTAERHELHELVGELPEDQVTVALADLRRRLPPSGDKARAPEFFGIVDEVDLPSGPAKLPLAVGPPAYNRSHEGEPRRADPPDRWPAR